MLLLLIDCAAPAADKYVRPKLVPDEKDIGDVAAAPLADDHQMKVLSQNSYGDVDYLPGPGFG